METEAIKTIATAAVMTAGTMVPAMAIGWLAGKAMEAIGRNPEAGPRIQTSMVLAIAFAEAIAIYALVIALVIKFV